MASHPHGRDYHGVGHLHAVRPQRRVTGQPRRSGMFLKMGLFAFAYGACLVQ